MMLRTILLIAAIAFLFACEQPGNEGFAIKGTIHEIEDGKVFLLRRNPKDLSKHDTIASADMVEGKFTLTGKVDSPVLYTLVFENSKAWGELVVENTELDVEANPWKLRNPRVEGGIWHEKVMDPFWMNYDRNYKSWKTQVYEQDIYEAREDGIRKEEDERLIKRWRKALGESNKMSKELFENLVDTAQNPVFKALILQKYMMPSDSVKVQEVIKDAAAIVGEDAYLIQFLQARDTYMRNMRAARKSVSTGKKGKNFTAKDIEGNEHTLYDYLKKNEYVLLEFWASWCAPCRAEAPNLVKAYNKYHEKGFEVFSFSLDDKREKWIEASEEEEFEWINTSDLKARSSEIVELYGVNGIPANFLLNKKGEIVATNLRNEKLHTELEKFFSGNHSHSHDHKH